MHTDQSSTPLPHSELTRYGNNITNILEQLHKKARYYRNQGCTRGANRLLLASGLLCLATWTLSGMSGRGLTSKIVELHYLLINVDKYPQPTNRASPDKQAHGQN